MNLGKIIIIIQFLTTDPPIGQLLSINVHKTSELAGFPCGGEQKRGRKMAAMLALSNLEKKNFQIPCAGFFEKF